MGDIMEEKNNENSKNNENMAENTAQNMAENVGSSEVAVKAETNIIFLVIGWIAAVLSLFAYPFIFGVVGVIMGILAVKNGSRAGLPLIISSIILMGVGMIYSGVIMNYVRHYLGI